MKQPARGRVVRTGVIVGCCLLVVAACGFKKGDLNARTGGLSSLSDGVAADTQLTQDTASSSSSFSDSYSDYGSDSYGGSSSDSAPRSGGSSSADPSALIGVVLDPPGLPAKAATAGPPARQPATPDGKQLPVLGTYTYDNLDDFLYGDWNCLACRTSVKGFAGAVDKLGKDLQGRFTSVSLARFATAAEASGSYQELVADRRADNSGAWQQQLPSVPGIPGARASVSKLSSTGQDYEVHFVAKNDLFIMDFATELGLPVDQNAANAFALLQYQSALKGG